MENHIIHLWRGITRLQLEFNEDPLDSSIAKIVDIGNRIFFQTLSKSIYYGDVPVKDEHNLTVDIKKSKLSAIDIATDKCHLFLVDSNNFIITVNHQTLEVDKTIILRNGCRSFKQGYVLCFYLIFFLCFILMLHVHERNERIRKSYYFFIV